MRGRRTGRSARTVGLLVALVLVAVACNGGWAGPHSGPDQSGFNPDENVIGVGNVATLTNAFNGAVPFGGGSSDGPAGVVGSAAVENGRVFVARGTELAGFDVAHTGGGTYAPVWRRTLKPWKSTLPTDSMGAAAPVVAGGRVYAITEDRAGYTKALRAFDGTKTDDCADPGQVGGCPPLWEAPIGTTFGSPTVVGGILYTQEYHDATGTLQAYDAAGVTGCSGVPKVCTPLWTAPTRGSTTPVVVNGLVYATAVSTGEIDVYDASGSRNCGGSPKVCQPLWRTTGTGQSVFAAVSDGRLIAYNSIGNGPLAVFDAAGTTNCSGTPVVCTPLWRANVMSSGAISHPAIAYGNVYVPSSQGIAVFDLAGLQGCGGTPTTCTPMRLLKLATWNGVPATNFVSVSVANGVVYFGTSAGELVAFDARSTSGCTGAPLACPPAWSTNLGSKVTTTVGIAAGRLFVGTEDGVLHVFAPA